MPGMPDSLPTSSETNGMKYMPNTKEFMGFSRRGTRYALCSFFALCGKIPLRGKLLFFGNSNTLEQQGCFSVKTVSGHVPSRSTYKYLPTKELDNASFEDSIEAIVEESHKENVVLTSGVPVWGQHYLDVLCRYTGKKKVDEGFPNLECYAYGGANLTTYKATFDKKIGKKQHILRACDR